MLKNSVIKNKKVRKVRKTQKMFHAQKNRQGVSSTLGSEGWGEKSNTVKIKVGPKVWFLPQKFF